MQKTIIQFLLITTGGVSCSHLFYQEDMGINTVFFSVPLLIIAFASTYRSGPYSKEVGITAVGAFLSAVAVVGNDSLLAKVMFWVSLLIFLGFIKHPKLKFLPLVTSAALSQLIINPWTLVQKCASSLSGSSSPAYLIKQAIHWLVPIGLFSIFGLIYYLANDKFSGIIDAVLAICFPKQGQVIASEQFALFLLGFLLVSATLLKSPLSSILSKWQQGFTTQLLRKRSSSQATYFSSIALKNQFKLSIITLTLLNALICIVNLTDLIYVWFSQRVLTAAELSMYVHEGTNLLIIAILIAAGVVLVIFRKNLNFYPTNEGLKKLAYIWIGQNIFMVFSVAIRNLQYLSNYGLTYKRIGVFVFLLMVLIGLVTLFLKIRYKKSHYFLWHRNTWAVYMVLLFCGFINWNLLITRVNLHPNFIKHLDVHYLIYDLPQQNAFLLKKHQNTLLNNTSIEQDQIQKSLDEKVFRASSKRSIYSWNWPYHLNRKYQQQ